MSPIDRISVRRRFCRLEFSQKKTDFYAEFDEKNFWKVLPNLSNHKLGIVQKFQPPQTPTHSRSICWDHF